jgi:hypothetical protein
MISTTNINTLRKIKNMKTSIKLLGFTLIALWTISACSKDDESTDGPTDSEGPTLVSVSPSDGASGVSIDQDITATFSEEIDPLSVTSGSFSVSSGGNQVSGSLSISGRTVSFSPSSSLAFETVYTITAATSITDLANNRLTTSGRSTFTTEDAPDTTGPTVELIDPEDGATDIFITRNVVVTFSETVDLATLVPGQSIKLVKEGSSTNISGTINISGPKLTYVLPELELSTKYIFTLTSAVKDLSGNAMTTFTSSFNTSVPTDNTPPTVTSISPSNGYSSVTYGEDVHVYFSEAIDPATVNSSNFYIAKDGNPISATVTMSSESHVKINPQSNLKGGATYYTVKVSNQVKDLAGNSLANQFTSAFTTINDYVDVQSRSIGESDVSIDGNISITFNVDMDASTINSSNVYIRLTTSDNSIPASISVSGKTVTINPDQHLKEFETGYVLTVLNSVKDTRGNYPYASQFLFYTEAVSDQYKYQIRASNSSWNLLGSYIDGQNWVDWTTDGNTYCNNQWYFLKRNDGTYAITHDCTPNSAQSTFLEGGGIGGAAVMNDCYCTGQFWTLVKDQRSNGSTLFSMYNTWLGSEYRLDAQDQIGMQSKNNNDPQQYWQLIRMN